MKWCVLSCTRCGYAHSTCRRIRPTPAVRHFITHDRPPRTAPKYLFRSDLNLSSFLRSQPQPSKYPDLEALTAHPRRLNLPAYSCTNIGACSQHGGVVDALGTNSRGVYNRGCCDRRKTINILRSGFATDSSQNYRRC